MSERVSKTQKLPFSKIAQKICCLIFFALFFLYLWIKVDLRLIYHGGGVVKNFPVFYLDWNFFREHLLYPGGLAEYLTAFLAQLWYISWAGALVATLTAWLIFVFTDKIFKLINLTYLHLISYAGPILLLSIYTRYVYHFDTAVSLLISLGFVVLYLKITSEQQPRRLSVFLVLSVILYYLGGRSYPLFAISCGILEFFFYRRAKPALIYLLLAFAVPYLAEGIIFGFGAHDTFLRHLPIKHSSGPLNLRNQMPVAACVLYFMMPVILLIIGVGRITIRRIGFNRKQTDKKLSPIVTCALESIKTVILFVSACLSIFLSYSPKSLVLKADYYACKGQWLEVIQTARQLPKSLLMVHMANRALYHTGRLGYDMFSFPQSMDVLLLSSNLLGDPESSGAAGGHWKRFGTCMDIGFLNSAQHSLADSLEMYGQRPVLLKNLALIYMAKDDLNSARVYLGRISRTLFHDKWAKGYLEKLESDPSLDNDIEVKKLRNIMLNEDSDFNAVKIEDIFVNSHQSRASFEYMMSSYLLLRDLEGILNNIRFLKDFDYAEIPRLYEEAILLYMFQGKKSVYLYGYKISEATHQRFNDYMTILTVHKGDKRAAQSELAKNFDDSYLYFYMYGAPRIIK